MAKTLLNVGMNVNGAEEEYINPQIAAEFSTSKAYSVGYYCTYQGQMYKFTAAKTAGAWDASKVTAVNVADDVGDLKIALYKNRSNITLDSMARFTGTVTDARDLPDDTWILKNGTVMQPLLGVNFSDTLVDLTYYVLRKISVGATSKRYELYSYASYVRWTGFAVGTDDIVWHDWEPDNTLTQNDVAANAKTVGDLFFKGRAQGSIDIDSMAKFTGTVTDARNLPENTWYSKAGSVIQGIVGPNFKWELASSTYYILSTKRVGTTTRRFELSSTYSAVKWTGTSVSGGDILWYSAFQDTVELTGINIDSTNYTEYSGTEYEDPNNITTAGIVRYASSITSDMIPNLPIYGVSQCIETIRYTPSNITTQAARFSRMQISWGAASNTGSRYLFYRVAFSQAASSWGNWYSLSDNDVDGLTPVYVAIGTSVTRGEIHARGRSTVITDYPYPQYFGALNKCEVHNLAQGGTGLVNRGSNGTQQNFMDVITANADLISTAKLITLEWGGNDSSILGGRMGEVTDYFKYEDYVNDYDAMKANATEIGALNWCINKIYELNQQVTLILITGTWYAKYLTATVDKNAGTVTYSGPSSTNWLEKQRLASIELLEKTGIPTIYCSDGYPMTAYNNVGDDSNGFLGYDGVHPTNEGYLMKARYMAGEIGKFFTH